MTDARSDSGTNCWTHTAMFLEQVPTLTTKHADGLPIFFGRRATRKKKKIYYCSWQKLKLKSREMRMEIMKSNIF